MPYFTYMLRPTNWPTNEPAWQGVPTDQQLLSLDYVATQIATKLGYQTEVVKNVLSGLSTTLPELLSLGIVDLNFIVLSLALTGSTDSPSTSWTSATAPFGIKTTLRNKSAMIAMIRNLVTMQKVPYVPKIPTFSDIDAGRYQLSGFVPVSSLFSILGQDLKLTAGRELRGYASENAEWSNGDGTAFLFDDVGLTTGSRVLTKLPYAMMLEVQTSPYVKLAITDEETTYQSPSMKVVYGGVPYLGLLYSMDNYQTMSTITKYRFTLTDGVLSVAIKSGAAPDTYGPDVNITDVGEIELVDTDTSPNTFTYYVGPGAIEFYTSAAAVAPYEIEGFRE
jgi:hypothetical protein